MASSSKIINLTELAELVSVLKKKGKKVVWTNGCFDILHAGHIHLLEQARSFGDILIVGLNTDDSIKRLKGPERPINPENERVQVISALSPVDYIVLFEEDTPCNAISILMPDIHVKGGDYDPNDYEKMPEAKIINEYGGEVKIIPLVKGHSTTNIIKKIKSVENR